jgi:hypothetical protein
VSYVRVFGKQLQAAMKALFQLAYCHHPQNWIPKKDLYLLVAANQDNDERLNWFGDFSGDKKKSAQVKLGKAISLFKNRILSGIKLEIDQSLAETQNWKLRWKLRFTKRS